MEQVLDYKVGVEYEDKTSTQDRVLSSVLFAPNNELTSSSQLFSMSKIDLRNAYVHYINLLIKKIAQYDSIENCTQEAANFRMFIEHLMLEYEQVKIYSTNYDTLCPQILSESSVYTATCNDPSNAIEQDFVYDLTSFNNHPLTYFFLHGCTKLRRDPGNRIKYCLIEQPLPIYAIDNSAGNPDGLTYFSPIISGYNKLQQINGKPFIFGTQAFANDLQDSNTVLALGYSFSDPHINSYLSTFSKGNSIISVTKDPVRGEPIDLYIEKKEGLISVFIYDYLRTGTFTNKK